MTSIQAINEQTKYDHFFCRVIRDQKLATGNHQIQSDNLYADFGHFFSHLSLIMY